MNLNQIRKIPNNCYINTLVFSIHLQESPLINCVLKQGKKVPNRKIVNYLNLSRHKGKLGKLVENNLFGQKPNCDP